MALKECRICHSLLCLDQFYKCGKYYRTDCIHCNNEISRKYKAEHLQEIKKSRAKYYTMHREACIKYVTEWGKKHAEQKKINAKKCRDINIEKYRKQMNVGLRARRYMKKHHLSKQPCIICNSDNAEAHHIDYNKPFELMWLCKPHHMAWHRLFLSENDI